MWSKPSWFSEHRLRSVGRSFYIASAASTPDVRRCGELERRPRALSETPATFCAAMSGVCSNDLPVRATYGASRRGGTCSGRASALSFPYHHAMDEPVHPLASVPIGPAVPQLTVLEIEDRLSVFDTRTQTVLALNETASDVWRLADGEHTGSEIVKLLAQAYAVSPDAIRADVYAAIGSFLDADVFVTETGQARTRMPLPPTGPHGP